MLTNKCQFGVQALNILFFPDLDLTLTLLYTWQDMLSWCHSLLSCVSQPKQVGADLSLFFLTHTKCFLTAGAHTVRVSSLECCPVNREIVLVIGDFLEAILRPSARPLLLLIVGKKLPLIKESLLRDEV